jgi:formylglycine-generating enzyme required for sulfatase activity
VLRLKFRSYRVLMLLSILLLTACGSWHLLTKLQRDRLIAQEYEPPPLGMVFVPAGEFWMGSDDPRAEPDEKPLRKVFVPAFYIDQFEVTNRRYKEFKKDHRYPAGEDDFPVSHVLKRDAEAFCRWMNRRLPAAAEWEKAARGSDGRVYTWGNVFRDGLANINRRPGDTNGLSCKLTDISSPSKGKLPVGSFPQSISPYGCHDMAGNIWEWVGDVWQGKGVFGTRLDIEPRGILRGGASSYGPLQARVSHQGFEALDTTCNDVGFRCAMDAVPIRK